MIFKTNNILNKAENYTQDFDELFHILYGSIQSSNEKNIFLAENMKKLTFHIKAISQWILLLDIVKNQKMIKNKEGMTLFHYFILWMNGALPSEKFSLEDPIEYHVNNASFSINSCSVGVIKEGEKFNIYDENQDSKILFKKRLSSQVVSLDEIKIVMEKFNHISNFKNIEKANHNPYKLIRSNFSRQLKNMSLNIQLKQKLVNKNSILPTVKI